ncbi:MAG: TonB-dependent hemoglobin/transferrin/lactoferrin family receptor [Pseudomonadota bacterium]
MLRNRLAQLSAVGTFALMSSASVLAQQVTQLDGIIITSSKVDEAAIDVLGGASSVGRNQLDEQFSPDRISSVLRTIPGVTTQETARDTGVAINIRGLQDFGRVNVLIDGARQNFQRSGHSANGVVYFDPEMIGSVDVTRGPTSTVYGSGAIGGVVQFNLLNADDILKPGETAAGRVRSRLGTNGPTRLYSATAAVKVGNFDIVGQVNARRNDNADDADGNEILNDNDDTDSKFIKMRFRPAQGHEISGTFIDYDSEFVDRIEPAGGTRRESDIDNQQFTLGYTYKSTANTFFDFDAKVYANRTTLEQVRLDATDTDRISVGTGANAFNPFTNPTGCAAGPFVATCAVVTNVFIPAGSARSVEVHTRGFDVHNTSRFKFGGTSLALTYGIDGFKDRVASVDPIDNQDEFTPGGERSVYGGFAQAKFTFLNNTIDLVGALRYDKYALDGSGVELDDDHLSPKVTLAVRPVAGITVFATYAEAFRAPATSETLISGLHPVPADFRLIPNPNLRPEVAHNVEIGLNAKYDRVLSPVDVFRFKAVGFRNEVDDFIDGVSIAGPIGLLPFQFGGAFSLPIFNDDTFQYQNRNSVLIEGVEIEAVYDAKSWFMQFAAAHIRGRDQETGEGIRSIPADQITLTAGFRAFQEKLIAGARTRFVANQERFTDATGLGAFTRADGYVVVDLFSQYKLSENATFNLNIDNLFDKQYRQHLDQDNSPGFAARFGMTMRFGK